MYIEQARKYLKKVCVDDKSFYATMPSTENQKKNSSMYIYRITANTLNTYYIVLNIVYILYILI